MSDNRFREQLRRQVKFIENSCSAYDQGQTFEAVRIATVLRVVLHDTPKSTSLLTHLNAKNVLLLSTCRVHEDILSTTVLFFEGLLLASSAGFKPKLGQGSARIELPATDWWEQVVLGGIDLERNLSRKTIALMAANKDGGAHVDDDLPKDYQAMDRGLWIQDKTQPLSGHQLMYLRQMGYEILNSHHLLDLAKDSA